MQLKWVKITDVREFMSRGVTRKGRHEFTERALHWPYCKHCGLLLLKNDATRAEAKRACVWLDD